MRVERNHNFADPFSVVILAAGLGKRMKLDLPKVLAPILGKPMICHILAALKDLSPQKIVVVVGHKGEQVREVVLRDFPSCNIIFAEQKELRGTGDAAQIGFQAINDFSGTVLILPGDVPLIKKDSLAALLDLHHREKATLSFISFIAHDPFGYGRVFREGGGATELVKGIVEERDASDLQKEIKEVASGIYAVDSAFLNQALKTLEPNNSQGELYLTDIVSKAAAEGQHIAAFVCKEQSQFLGVNSILQLSLVQSVAMKRITESLLERGVMIPDPDTVYVDESATIDQGTFLGPNTQIRGASKIGKGVKIEGTAYIVDSIIEDNVVLKFGVRIEKAFVGKGSSVGPFAHLRPETHLEANVKIGNFVEVKKSHLEEGVSASHLAYLGDADIGKETNIGAGTITCNYDGYKKHKTKIGRDVFIGSNSSLVAPVTVGDGAIVGAGSVITKDVSGDALAFERSDQKEVSGWAKKRREKHIK